ncbi:chaplin [Streptomyces naphthomycinicus]|uniref:chaplin n=1 Tax=Streptomyces naphthomycinicus TaxID=2872625 RepID=UPI001CED5FFA|nr:chaplin [Streptomyces sp. TML10]
MIAVAATAGAMAVALPVSAAFAADGADARGAAAGSPGLVSGNGIQLPVHVPVNVCGNTVNVVGLLNPAAGNDCANTGGAKADGAGETGGSAGSGKEASSGGADARGAAAGSPGVLSGNGVQLPVDLPVNISGNSVDVIGVGNPAVGNQAVDDPGEQTRRPPRTATPKPRVPKPRSPRPAPRPAAAALAHTGADLTAPAAVGSVALLGTGAILYRRFRPGRSG